MKFLLLSDIHATSKNPVSRKDNILEAFISKLSYVIRCAMRRDMYILQAGDFCHKPRDWQVLMVLVSLLRDFKNKIYHVYGQHDMYLYSSETNSTTMGVLAKTGIVFPLKPTATYQDEVYLYGASWGQPVPKPTKNKEGCNILVIHAPISKKEVYPGHDYTSPKYFMKKHPEYNLILVGDTHRAFVEVTGNQTLVNTGPMLRLEATDYNMKHEPHFWVYDTEDMELKEKVIIPHEPAKDVLEKLAGDDYGDIQYNLTELSSALSDTKSEFTSLEKVVASVVKKLKKKRVRQIISEVMEETDES